MTEQRLSQLIRQPKLIPDRQFEVECLDSGVDDHGRGLRLHEGERLRWRRCWVAPHANSFEVGPSTRRRTWGQVTAGPVAPGSVCGAQNFGDLPVPNSTELYHTQANIHHAAGQEIRGLSSPECAGVRPRNHSRLKVRFLHGLTTRSGETTSPIRFPGPTICGSSSEPARRAAAPCKGGSTGQDASD